MAFVHDSTVQRCYVDGVEYVGLDFPGSLSGDIRIPTTPISINAVATSLTGLSDVYVASRPLSAAEIAALCANPDLPLWQPRRGISLALVAVGGGAVLPMFGGPNLGKSLFRGANL